MLAAGAGGSGPQHAEGANVDLRVDVPRDEDSKCVFGKGAESGADVGTHQKGGGCLRVLHPVAVWLNCR